MPWLAACGVPQPANEEVVAPPGAAEAATIVVEAWSELLGAELDLGDLPPVRWFEGPCLDYGDHGELRCTRGGYAEFPGAEPEIHLVVETSIRESELAHEALHWALDATTGEPDQDHATAARWSLVPEVEDALGLAGL